MNTHLLKAQIIITRVFLWTSPLVLILLLATNFPSLEKDIWTSGFAPILALTFAIWFISLIFVVLATFISSKYKEQVLHNVILRKDHDEREELISGQAAKKSILVTLAASILILICTTGQYNKAETTEKSSVTIGHFKLSDEPRVTTQTEDGSTIVHYQIPMSKMSLVLLLILIQLSSYHSIKIFNLRKLEV